MNVLVKGIGSSEFLEIIKMKKLITILILLDCINAGATNYNYYIAANGNDANNGTSISTPWQTLSKVNVAIFRAGDSILFNRGDVFYGSIIIKQSGTAGSPITFSTYGIGANPIITGFTTVRGWSNQGSNIWISDSAVSTTSYLNMVFVNGSFAQMGRYPNTGWATYQSETLTGNNRSQRVDSIYITSSQLTGSPNWTGAELFIYGNHYAFDRCAILNQVGGTVSFRSTYHPVYDRDIPHFIIQNDVRTLDTANEWYYSPSTKKMQIYSMSAPANIQVATVDNLVIVTGYNYIIFDGLSFLGSNVNAIQLISSKYITIRNCSITYTGKDAVNGSSGVASTGLLINNCIISNTNNYGIKLSNENFDYAVIQGNTITKIGLVAGMTDITAIAIDAQGANSSISYNRVDSTCWLGIQFLGDRTTVNNNYITNFDNFLTDGGGIYTWNGWGGVVKSNIRILNNIIINQHTGGSDIGIYLDDWSNNIEVNGNTVRGCGWGISGGNAFHISYLNNTSFDNDNGQMFLLRNPEIPVPGKVGLDSIIMKNNIFFVKLPVNNGVGSHSMFIMDGAAGSVLPTHSTFDSNYYVSPTYTKGSIYSYFKSTGADRYLPSWQSYSGQDLHSHETPKAIADSSGIIMVYNPTTSLLTIPLSYNYMDARGATYNGKITLQPYTSAVLIKNGNIL